VKTFIAGLMMLALASAAVAKDPKVGQPAPEFELTLIDGSKVKLSELRGNVVVLNYWATWCVPCKQELPLLDRYYRLQKSHGLRVFAITTEDSASLRELKDVFRILEIPSARRLRGPYRPEGGVPTNFVIDKAGRLRLAQAGAFDLDALNALLVPLLNEPAPPS
jgi:peroxiredoxin